MKFTITLLATSLLAAAPAWAQTTGTQPAPATSAPAATAAAPAPSTAPPAASAPSAAATTPKSAMHHSHAAASAIPPGQTMEALVEKRIDDLHRQLHIASTESSQWDQFAQVMRDNAKEIDQAYADRAQKIGSMSAVDSMQSYAQIEQLRAQQMQKLVPAFQTLYASLSDQQKQQADALFRNQAAKAQAHRQAAAAKHAAK
jgi:protein CpxP